MNRIAVAACTWGLEPDWDWIPQRCSTDVIAAAAALGFEGLEPATGNGFGDTLAAELRAAGLACPARFVGLPLHDPDATVAAGLTAAAALRELGGSVLMAGPSSPDTGRPDARGLERLARELAADGMTVVAHPEAGSSMGSVDDVQAVLDGAPSVQVCLETGHLWAMGCEDIPSLVGRWGDRIRHVHLKDVSGEIAGRLRRGEIPEIEANRAGLWQPPGEGDVPLAETVSALLGAGYDGWLVVEDDAADDPDRSARLGLDLVRRALASS